MPILILFVAAFSGAAFGQNLSLAEALRSAREIKVTRPLVHSATKVRRGNSEKINAYRQPGAGARANCSMRLVHSVSRTQAAALFIGAAGESFSDVRWLPGPHQGQPATHFECELALMNGLEFVPPARVEERRSEYRKCERGRWDNWYDHMTGEVHRDYICERYASDVDHYNVSVSWIMSPRAAPSVKYEVKCELLTRAAADTILLNDFMAALGRAMEIR